MIENDKILEAEKSITLIAEELKKIQSAAHLLENAQTQVESVLSSSSQVVEATGTFTSKAGQIISELESTNLNSRLDDLSNDFIQLSQVLGDHSKNLSDMSNSHQELSSTLQSQFASSQKAIVETKELLSSKLNNYSLDLTELKKSVLLWGIIHSVLLLVALVLFLILR